MSERVLVVLLGLLLGAAIFLAADAAATPAQRDAALAGTDQWISLVLHVPITERADVPGVKGELAPNAGFVNCLDPGVARYAPRLYARLSERRDLYFEDAFAVVLHEHLHLLGGGCTWLYGAPDPAWLFWEEGFVEAVRVDMFPAYFRAMFGRRVEWSVEPFDSYVANVAAAGAAGGLAGAAGAGGCGCGGSRVSAAPGGRGMSERIEEARALLLSTLDDLDSARDEGRALTDFVILLVAESDEEADTNYVSTGLSVSAALRLGTLDYFLDRHRHWIRRDHFGDDE